MTTKNKGGRPTKYTEQYAEAAEDYAKGNYLLQDRVIPTIEGFSISCGIPLGTIYRWAEKHARFRESLDQIKNHQREILLTKGLLGEFNSTIAKLVLSANHGMNEKTESELSGNLGVFEIDYTGAPQQG